MTDAKVTQEIHACIEDVNALLESNRHISVAFLSRRVRDIETEMRDRFRQWQADREKRVDSLEEQVKILKERLQVAGQKFREMRDELDAMKKQEEGS